MELGFLTPLFERPGPWASVYVDTALVSEDAAARQELKARAVCDRLADQGADQDTCRVLYDALIALPRTDNPPGRAVFATEGEVVLDPALATPPSGGPWSCWSALPHTGPLLELSDGEPTCLIAYVDRVGADFELRGPLGTQPAGQVSGDDWPVHRTSSADWSERHFQDAVENTWEQNAATIAEAVDALRQETGAELVVLAGDPRERRSVHVHLPVTVQESVVETEHGSRAPGADNRNLDLEVEAARRDRVERRVSETMDRFRASRVPDDHGRLEAAEGVPALVDAAREHRIGSLLVRLDGPDRHREVWVGQEPDQLAVRRTETQYLGDPHPVAARADDALLRSAATTGAEVLAIRPETGAPSGLPVGGLGALLRWPYDGGTEGGSDAAGQ